MILIVRSAAESLTEPGLQALFSDSTPFLALGFVMSIKKIITANLAMIAASKNGNFNMCITDLGLKLSTFY